jgi:hypothetical protein
MKRLQMVWRVHFLENFQDLLVLSLTGTNSFVGQRTVQGGNGGDVKQEAGIRLPGVNTGAKGASSGVEDEVRAKFAVGITKSKTGEIADIKERGFEAGYGSTSFKGGIMSAVN